MNTVAAEDAVNSCHIHVMLTLVKFGYIMGDYVSAEDDAEVEKGLVRVSRSYTNRVKRIFATERLQMCGERKNVFANNRS